ncbi:uncharacterized protein MEPE_02608 [Melanopsichium pennsylvanicum]|uniref:Uncharacterized protein n=2 Tax=Melanopsichium pennsylvanicum TaxID=63383 RepID=A0AAJ4XK17_9BASI|nr:uncharacterized protein BN887_05291 [Melanopsichium pennsylvanicum 4]SNX83900.1 uncharacterized protein MEPE_02608 [Melanopsichium pennsylvanicum]
MLDECLELFIDLRSPVRKPHPYKHAPKVNSAQGETPSRFRHLTISGWGVDVFGVVGRLRGEARTQLCRLFDLTESQRKHSTRKLRASNMTPGIASIRQLYRYGGRFHTCYTNVKGKPTNAAIKPDVPCKPCKPRKLVGKGGDVPPAGESDVPQPTPGSEEHCDQDAMTTDAEEVPRQKEVREESLVPAKRASGQLKGEARASPRSIVPSLSVTSRVVG